MMNIPIWIKPALYDAVAGGVTVAIVGFAWGGWVTGGSAQATAVAAADESRTDLAAAICIQNFMAHDNTRESLAQLKDLTSAARQREMIEAGGWARMPSQDSASRATVTLCSRMLLALEPTELPIVDDGEVVEPGDVIEPNQTMTPEVESSPEAEPAVAE